MPPNPIKISLNAGLLKTFLGIHCPPSDNNEDDEVNDDGYSFQIMTIKANKQRPPKIDLKAKCVLAAGGDGIIELEVTLDQKTKTVSIDCSGCDIDVCPHGIGLIKWLRSTTNVKIPVKMSPPPVPPTKRGRQPTGTSPVNPRKVLKETANQARNEPIVIEDEYEDDESSDDESSDETTKPKTLKTISLDAQSSAALTMVQLMRTFTGSTATESEFIEHCRSKMAIERCDEAQLLTVEQAGTTLWHQLRVGRITASRIHQASRCKMSHGSLYESIMGYSRGGFSFAMDRGTKLEDRVFNVVLQEYPGLQKSGLLLNSQYPYFGASPDGIHDDFVLEIKCPVNRNTHFDYVTPGKLKKQYAAQIQMQMRLADKRKALLAVADPSFERNKKITKVWIAYDQEYTEKLMEDAYDFWVQSIFAALKRHQPQTAE